LLDEDDPIIFAFTRQYGKGLTANRSGHWRYRIGDCRVIVNIQDDRLIVLSLEAGHRREIY